LGALLRITIVSILGEFMLSFNWYQFSELTVEQLYTVLMLRSDVFIVEQNCVYPDADGKDLFAHHLLVMENNALVAYLRVFPPTDLDRYIVFGRVVTPQSVRTKGYGRKLMQELLNYCEKNYPGMPIKCSAQNYLREFYSSFGFIASGTIYDEDGIPHIAMSRGLS
jgi:ElaA protein